MSEKQAERPEEETGSDEEKQSDEERVEEKTASKDESAEDAGGDEALEEEPPPAPRMVPGGDKPAPNRPNYAFLAAMSVLFFAADFVTKWLVVTYDKASKPRPTTEGWHLRLNNVEGGNPGGAWGIFGDKPDYIRLPFFFLISAVAVVFVVSLYRKLEPKQTALKWALPLLLGGALGNLVDRIRHKSVIDFIEFSITKAGGADGFRWPTFNVADIWICVGVVLMAVDMFTPRKKVPPKPIADDEAEAPREARPRNVKRSLTDDSKEKAAKVEA
ncbi:MAG: signal peptidase II [Polyangiaceae bacterium]